MSSLVNYHWVDAMWEVFLTIPTPEMVILNAGHVPGQKSGRHQLLRVDLLTVWRFVTVFEVNNLSRCLPVGFERLWRQGCATTSGHRWKSTRHQCRHVDYCTKLINFPILERLLVHLLICSLWTKNVNIWIKVPQIPMKCLEIDYWKTSNFHLASIAVIV